MADKIFKFLSKIIEKDRKILILIIKRILDNDLNNLNIVKIKGTENIYRCRKGMYRIIFEIGEVNRIISVYNRDDNTYRDF